MNAIQNSVLIIISHSKTLRWDAQVFRNAQTQLLQFREEFLYRGRKKIKTFLHTIVLSSDQLIEHCLTLSHTLCPRSSKLVLFANINCYIGFY